MKIWAHRGCSQRYPENTILSFEKALELKKLIGIELDIQLTKDKHMVVIHDERVDRTTDGIGEVRQYTLSELKKLNIDAGNKKKDCQNLIFHGDILLSQMYAFFHKPRKKHTLKSKTDRKKEQSKMKLSLFSAFLIIGALPLLAVPAKPTPIKFTQPD